MARTFTLGEDLTRLDRLHKIAYSWAISCIDGTHLTLGGSLFQILAASYRR